jgi:hypothetical protein
MRYRSVLSVDFVLIDARKDLNRMWHIIEPALVVMQRHYQYHIVFLCKSVRNADKIDELGENIGQELFFHGELPETAAEIDQLLKHSKAIFVPDISWPETSRLCKVNNIAVPIIHFFEDRAKFYPHGVESSEYLEMPLLDCFEALDGRKQERAIK